MHIALREMKNYAFEKIFDMSEKKEIWGPKSSQSDLWSELESVLITEMSRILSKSILALSV
jgi:hypothetical protein